jgi:hypothetical protein
VLPGALVGCGAWVAAGVACGAQALTSKARATSALAAVHTGLRTSIFFFLLRKKPDRHT